jgi:quinol monooxygenase YgiN
MAGSVPTEGPASQETERCCPVIELRQYTLHPGQRETLIDLFDREFIETQEATGMTVVAQFRDLDRPDVFTWIRGFPDMTSRAEALGAFYGGPVWSRHREAANATMVSSDNVWLLRPVGPGFALEPRAASVDPADATGLIVASICTLAPAAADAFAGFFARSVAPLLAAHGAKPIAVFETEPSANTYAPLPLREGERAFVWFARFVDQAAYDRHVRDLSTNPRWTTDVGPQLEQRLAAPVETWRLAPTSRSRSIR